MNKDRGIMKFDRCDLFIFLLIIELLINKELIYA